MRKVKISDYIKFSRNWIRVTDLAKKLKIKHPSVSEFIKNNPDLFLIKKKGKETYVIAKHCRYPEPLFSKEIEGFFDTIRKYTRYCGSCGKTLDLEYADWHLPFCKKCRLNVIEKELKIKVDMRIRKMIGG